MVQDIVDCRPCRIMTVSEDFEFTTPLYDVSEPMGLQFFLPSPSCWLGCVLPHCRCDDDILHHLHATYSLKYSEILEQRSRHPIVRYSMDENNPCQITILSKVNAMNSGLSISRSHLPDSQILFEPISNGK